MVERNVEITGDPSETNLNRKKVGSVDWEDISTAVIVERAAISINNLVIYQTEMGGGGLTLDFIHTREGATAVFAGTIIIVDTCDQSVTTYNAFIHNIPRPGFFDGDQKALTIGSNQLLVQDVAIWWPNLNSIWQFCNGMLVCIDDYDGEVMVEKYYSSGLIADTCAVIVDAEPEFSDLANLSALQRATESENQDGNKKDTSTTVIILATVVTSIFLATAALSYYWMCGKSKQTEHVPESKLTKAQSSLGSPKGDPSPTPMDHHCSLRSTELASSARKPGRRTRSLLERC